MKPAWKWSLESPFNDSKLLVMIDQQKNHDLARRLNRETRGDPNSPYAGKYLGIADEQVVVIADSLADVNAQLDTLGFDRNNSLWVEASADYESPIMFWHQNLMKEIS